MQNIQKNILDLNFQKHLVIASTTIIILFTYIIGIFIALISSTIKFNYFYLGLFSGFSTLLLGSCGFLFSRSYRKIKNIPEEIKALN
jgi:uncharacterized membrane protein